MIDAVFQPGFVVFNHGDQPVTVYSPSGKVLGQAMPGGSWPPPPGTICWERTGGKTWRVEIVR